MYLYAIQKANRSGNIKVGYTKDVNKRRNYLERKTGERLEIIHYRLAPYPRYAENYVHEQFSGARKLGEWFDLGESVDQMNLLFSIMDYAVDLVDPSPRKLSEGSVTEDAIRETILARVSERSVSVLDISRETKISQNKIKLITPFRAW
ncbi:GIY-YIG nuclease family protein [Deinococcus frigens]|uniref:GIY-YIG nuclease family protein n=1 Tax=Deinococcus frigens TaxID=249403 RepID=UPI000A076080|nr:GIY-YIG nuclease family protein [Deinococcus frigens]